jgi:hypothetical protein
MLSFVYRCPTTAIAFKASLLRNSQRIPMKQWPVRPQLDLEEIPVIRIERIVGLLGSEIVSHTAV